MIMIIIIVVIIIIIIITIIYNLKIIIYHISFKDYLGKGSPNPCGGEVIDHLLGFSFVQLPLMLADVRAELLRLRKHMGDQWMGNDDNYPLIYPYIIMYIYIYICIYIYRERERDR